MKKFIFIVTLLFGMITTGFSQTEYKPYIGAGSNLTTGTFSYGAEAGIYNNKAWFAFGASTYEVNDKFYWTVSAKAYYKIASQGIVDEFIYNAVNVTADSERAFSYEPGVAVVFNVTKHWAPQFTLSTPMYENTKVFRKITPSVGLGLNYFF